jgi:hypothetical protein
MSLTACVECGRQVSSTADACPHCGAPSPSVMAFRRRTRALADYHLLCRAIVWVSFFAFFLDFKDALVWVIGWCGGMIGGMYIKAARRNHEV